MSDERWLSDWLLGEGTDEERRQMESRLAADPALRQRARRLGVVTDRLRELPPGAWQAITDAEVSARRAPRAALTTLPRPAVAGLAAAVLFAVGLGAGALLWSPSGATPSRPAIAARVSLRPLDGAPVAATGIAYVTHAQQLELDVTHLPAVNRGQYYEAWLMTSASRLVPLASFRVDAHGHARLELQLPAVESSYRYIDVSLQRIGAGTAHSRRSVLRGPTVTQ